jgi:hypothetical protein
MFNGCCYGEGAADIYAAAVHGGRRRRMMDEGVGILNKFPEAVIVGFRFPGTKGFEIRRIIEQGMRNRLSRCDSALGVVLETKRN